MVTSEDSDDAYDDDDADISYYDDDADDIGDVPSVQDARRIVTSNPIKMMERRTKTTARDAAELLALSSSLSSYLVQLFDLPFCYSRDTNVYSACRCLYEHKENCPFDLVVSRLGECC